jgi:hypothetical protein
MDRKMGDRKLNSIFLSPIFLSDFLSPRTLCLGLEANDIIDDARAFLSQDRVTSGNVPYGA